MNVKDLIQLINLRPCMFIGELNLENLYHFISGFLFNNIKSAKADKFDMAFKDEFHEWVRGWIKNNKNIEFDEDRNYQYYIQAVCKDQEQSMAMFFKLSQEFFNELIEC